MQKTIFYSFYVLIVFTISFSLASNITGKNLGYPKSMGIKIQGQYYYYPWAYAVWGTREGFNFNKIEEKDDRYDQGFRIVLIGTTLSLLPAVFIFRKNKQKNDYIHGDSRWLENKDLKKAGLFNEDGVVLSMENTAKVKLTETPRGTVISFLKIGKLIVDNSNTHVAVCSPTRGGKGIGTIIPTLLYWQSSVICYDMKRENFDLTSGFRALFSIVIKVDFLRKGASKWNPLEEIRIDTEYEVTDAQIIAQRLMNPDEDKKSDFWLNTSIKVFSALVLYLINNPDEKEKSIRAIISILTSRESGYETKTDIERLVTLLSGFIEYDTGKKEINRIIKDNLMAFIAMSESEKQFIGVKDSILEQLNIYSNPIVAENISSSDFSVIDIMDSEKPVSLYYCVTAGEDRKLLNPLTKLFFTMFVTKKVHSLKKSKYRCLMLLDEFPTLGKMDIIESGLAYLAGYGIKMMLIFQDINQLYSVYGDKTSILGNCQVQMFYAPTDPRTAELLSKRLGTTTILTESTSSSGERTSFFNRNISRSTSQSAKALMTPRQVEEMPYDRTLIFIAGKPPYKAVKNAYYADDRFTYRLLPSVISDISELKSYKERISLYREEERSFFRAKEEEEGKELEEEKALEEMEIVQEIEEQEAESGSEESSNENFYLNSLNSVQGIKEKLREG